MCQKKELPKLDKQIGEGGAMEDRATLALVSTRRANRTYMVIGGGSLADETGEKDAPKNWSLIAVPDII